MPFQKGHKKVGGRVKGTPNKRTLEFTQILEDEGHCPVKQLIAIQKMAITKFQDCSPDQEIGFLSIAQRANECLLPYRYPKRKSLDVTSGEEPIGETLIDIVKALGEK